MTRQKEPFRPKHSRGQRPAKMFSCGPSIYSPPHIGNYRTFMWEDVLQRYLEYQGYEVKRVINLTDIEDKAIEEAQERGMSVGTLTGAIAERFVEEAGRLRIKLPEPMPRSSTSVKQAVNLIRKLLDKGCAYELKGDIFFDPLKFKGFGKLFRLDMSKWPKNRKRFKRDTYNGRRWNLGDFILWHRCKKDDKVCWDTEIGVGRPSWNVQDPAMISENLGWSVDIFCGGIDNLYRHHDYNIAVMESVSGRQLARLWLHGEHVLVGGKKMSKSLHNIVYPQDLIEHGYTWEQVRFYLLSRHYRKKLNLSMDAVRAESLKLNALRAMAQDLTNPRENCERTSPDEAARSLTDDLTSSFESAMNDDLDTPSAVEGLFNKVQRLHMLHKLGRIGKEQRLVIEEKLRKTDSVLQFVF
ncbi:MAG TPA: class I tRNA ligase family protein [Syntrophobacteraceae bacterium]|nr:class I tRNA ligase family protein [Syntrophobacteraceae bacterium]